MTLGTNANNNDDTARLQKTNNINVQTKCLCIPKNTILYISFSIKQIRE